MADHILPIELSRNAAMEAVHQMVTPGDSAKLTTVNFTVFNAGDRTNFIPNAATCGATCAPLTRPNSTASSKVSTETGLPKLLSRNLESKKVQKWQICRPDPQIRNGI